MGGAGAAAGIVGGAAVGAGGGILGTLLAPQGSNAKIFPTFNPNLDLALQGFIQDSLGQIGLQDFGNVPSPLEQLMGKISALVSNEKTKQKARAAIFMIGKGQLDVGEIQRELGVVLRQLGLDNDDVVRIFQEDREFKERQQRIQDIIGPIQEDTILNRSRSAQTASELIAQASRFAQTGDTQNPAQEGYLGRILRDIERQREQLLLSANFGGFQPGAALEGLNNSQLDAPLLALEQSLLAAQGIGGALGVGGAAAGGAAQLSTGSQLNSAQVAGQQASAAAALRSGRDAQNQALFANSVSGAASSFGTGISTASINNQNQANFDARSAQLDALIANR